MKKINKLIDNASINLLFLFIFFSFYIYTNLIKNDVTLKTVNKIK